MKPTSHLPRLLAGVFCLFSIIGPFLVLDDIYAPKGEKVLGGLEVYLIWAWGWISAIAMGYAARNGGPLDPRS